MPRAEVKSRLRPQALQVHAITGGGRTVLVGVQGRVSPCARVVAWWNRRRWNAGKRTWLF